MNSQADLSHLTEYRTRVQVWTSLDLSNEEASALVDILQDFWPFKYDQEKKIIYAHIDKSNEWDKEYESITFHFKKYVTPWDKT